MRILLAHNYYQQPGGEDQVFAAESDLLEKHGQIVYRLTKSNESIRTMRAYSVARATLWNDSSYREVRQVIRRERIDVVHFHNTFPLLSPASYFAARREGVPVVQTLHNYRLLCPGSLLYREGRPCEDCLRRAIPWPGMAHGCYRGSRAQTAAVAGMLAMHRAIGTWKKAVDVYVALTDFARDKFVEGGLPENKIIVKPNFLSSDPGDHADASKKRDAFALFAGRLTEDKGIHVLLEAWRGMKIRVPLKIAGDGPLRPTVEREAAERPDVEYLGQRPRDELLGLMQSAAVLVVPSLWYEGFPMTLVESYASGLPVIASDLGSLTALVREGTTGYRFPAGDAAALARCVERAFSRPRELSQMGINARADFLAHYSAERNYRALMDVYHRALAN